MPETVTGNLVDLVKGAVYPGTVAFMDGRIVSVTPHPGRYTTYIMPGFIDAHVHVESSMLVPAEFARQASRHGTVAAVSDPHEIANVLGLPGVRYMMENGEFSPFNFYFGAPSCVPATDRETSGAVLGPAEVEQLLADPRIRYLSEVMNYPGVIQGEAGIMAKIASAKRHGKVIDGHAPGLRGEMLRRYIAAGISTDHEALDAEEALEKLGLGMKILIREGSAARDFERLRDLIKNYPGQCMLCSDDKHPDELVRGHLDVMVRRALAAGIELLTILRCACANPVHHYGLDVGLLRPGDPADFLLADGPPNLRIRRVYIRGVLAAEDGEPLIERAPAGAPNRFAAAAKAPGDFAVKAGGSLLQVMEALDGQLLTEKLILTPTVADGLAVADPGRDLLKIAVVNRYQETKPAVGFIRGFGLRDGALASSVAHDSHNIVAVGVTDEDLCAAVNLVVENRGGLAAVAGSRREALPLPVAGLMSAGDGFEVAGRYQVLETMAKEMGSTLSAPFMTLSFMALLVIPRLKMSDRGLFDGERFEYVGLFE